MNGKHPEEKAEERINEVIKLGGSSLSLDNLHLTEIPSSTWTIKGLRSLSLCGNRITSLPKEIRELKLLQNLRLRGNSLTGLPPLKDLTNLLHIDLQNNKLHTLPAPLFEAISLEVIWANNNEIGQIPTEILHLQKLHTLDIWNNKLTEIPEEITRLTSLRSLNLWENKLSRLPSSIGDLPNLETLVLEDNELLSLPRSLQRLRKLKRLFLNKNNSLNIPQEILGPTYDAAISNSKIELPHPRTILDYYFRSQGGHKPLNEAKLILIGRGSVGKTTLVHQLIHGKFSPKTKTKGIKVSEWTMPSSGGEITTHVWDFGGQEIMHGTHQFFLTERSLYLLVLAGREDREDEDAEYWLKTIRAFGGDSPVIVILNKIREHYFEIDEEGLRQKYPNIVTFIPTDCKPSRKGSKATGIEFLQQIIQKQVAEMDSVKRAFPSAWFSIKQRLSGMKENFMTFDSFRAICRDFGEKHIRGQEELAHFLHLLGLALNYRDDPRLSETSVLNPKWVTTGIYKILNDSVIKKRRGVLKLADLSRILNAQVYPADMHDFLLRLMKKFDLCFPLNDEGSEHLIPELLGKRQPKLSHEFDTEGSLCFEFHYTGLLPEGLLPRFIVKSYTRIESHYLWRTGVVLSWKGARALVKADEHDRVILIRVRGESDPGYDSSSARELLDLIREHFDAIHSNFKKLDPIEKIRLPSRSSLVMELAKIEAFANERNDVFTEYHDGELISMRARQVLAYFSGGLPPSSLSKITHSPELALGMTIANRKQVK